MDDKEFLELHKNVTAFSRGEQPVFSQPETVELPRLEDVENYVPEENVAEKQQNIPELDMEQINTAAENTVNQYFKSGNEDGVYDDNDLQNVPVGEETNILDTIDQSDTMKAFHRSNAYKRYMYNGEEVIAEARKISKAMNVDEGLILSSPEALDNMRNAYKIFEKEKDIDKVYERIPGLKGLAEKDESAAAIALSNLEDVKVAHGIVDSVKAGVDSYRLQYNRNKIGIEGFYGKSLTAEDWDNIKKAEDAIKNAKELPEFFDAPIDNAIGETVQQLTMMGSQFARGSYLAGAGAFAGYFGTKAIGTFFGGGPLGTVATASLARQNAMRGMAIGARIGGTKEMFDELAGQYYLDALQYKNKAGGQQFTENEARLLAGIQAGIETAIEVADTEAILKVLGKNPATAEAKNIIKDIIKNAKNPESAIALLKTEGAAIISKMFKTGKIEALEEGKQQLSTDLVGNVFAAYVAPDGDEKYGLTVRGPEELLGRATEATVKAFVPSMGMGALGAGASTVRATRNFIGYMQMEEALNEVKLDFNNWTKNTNGVNMLRQLKENFANTKLAKEHPEEAQALLKETLKDSGYEEVVVDTELFKKEEGGSEILYQLAYAAGMSEEEAKTAIDNNENIVVPTDVYAKSVMDNPIADKLLDKISFDKEGDCLERCRKYAASMKHAWDKMIDAESMRKMEAAYNVLKDTIGEDDALDAMAMGIVELYPEDPAAGARKKVQEQQQEIDRMLKPVLDEMKKDIHKGVIEYYRNTETGDLYNPEDVSDLFGKEELKSGGSYERVVVSNNAIWYRNFVKAHGRVPTKTEMIQIAEDVFTGKNEYGVPGWEVNDIETEEAAEANARRLANLRADMAMYERLAEKLKDYDAGKVAAAEGLSESGYAAYKYLVNAIQGGEMNKATQRSAAVGAMLWAHIAERYAEAYQAMGQDVTALDVIKRFKFSNKDGAVGYNQQQAINPIIQEQMEAVRQKYEGTDQWMKAPDGTDTSLTEQQWLYAHTDYFKEKYGDWETLAENTFKGKVITEDAIKERIQKIRYDEFVNEDTGNVATFSKEGKSKIVSSAATRLSIQNGYTLNDHYTAVYNTPQLFKTAVLSNQNEDVYKQLESKDWYSAFCVLDKKPAIAVFTVKVTNNAGNKLYSLQLVELKNPAGILPEDENTRLPASAGSSTEIISQVDEKSNEDNAKNKGVPKQVYKLPSHKEGYEKVNTEALAEKFKDIHTKVNEHGEPDFKKLDVDESEIYMQNASAADNFNQWFASSKVVDADGNPKVMYHGTGTDGITEFKHSKAQDKMGRAMAMGQGKGKFYFATTEGAANIAAQGAVYRGQGKNAQVMPVYLKIENPINLDTYKQRYQEMSGHDLNEGYSDSYTMKDRDRYIAKLDKQLRKEGVDGIYDEAYGFAAVFEPTQIKSATGNNGNFDINNPNIYMQLAAEPERDLVAYHNISADNLRKALASGGLPVPSIAITQKDIPFTNFGDITLVGTRDIVDPENNTDVYSRDAYTTRVPEPEYKKATFKSVDAWRAKYKDKMLKLGAEDSEIERTITQAYNYPKTFVRELERSPEFMAYYLKEVKKIDIELPKEEARYTNEFLKNDAIAKEFEDAYSKYHSVVDCQKAFVEPARKVLELEQQEILQKIETKEKEIAELTAKGKGESTAVVLKRRKIKDLKDSYQYALEGMSDYIEKKPDGSYVLQSWITSRIMGEIQRMQNIKRNGAKVDWRNAKTYLYDHYSNKLEGYEQFVKQMADELMGEPRLKLGNKYVPYTLSNIVQAMIKQSGTGKEQGTFMSNAKVAAIAAKKLKSIDEIRKEKGQLKTNEEVKAVINEIDEYRNRVANEIAEAHDWYEYEFNEAFNNMLAEAAKGGRKVTPAKMAKAMAKFQAVDLSDEEIAKAVKVANNYVGAATWYFEAKPQRAVGLEEFAGAVVPDTTDPELIKQLEDLGLTVEQYGIGRTRQEATKAIQEQRDVLFQAAGQKQGFIEFEQQGEYIVHLLETADESTFMHEMSHGFYDMLKQMATTENAPDQIKKDYETLCKWTEYNPEQISEYKGTAVYSEFVALDNLIREAAENGSTKTVDENGNEHIESYQSLLNRWRQERFARGFEEYLRQGKAPTEGMKGIFSKFKNWLVKIYKGCVGVGAKPTEEVKAVMDRMIASQEEIDLAMKRAEILKWKEAGAEELLTKTSQEYYDNLLTKAREEAEAKVLKLAMKDLDAEEKAKYQAKLDKEREAATERIKQKPVFMIQQHLEQNPGLNVESVAKLLGNMNEAEYKQQLKLEGGSLEKAVDRYMEAYQRELDDESKPGGEQYQAKLRAAAEEAVVTSKYTDLIAAYELQTYKKAVQRIRRLEKRLADIEATDEAERKQAEAAIRKEEKARNEQEDRDTRVQDLRRELKSMKESIRAYGKNSQDEITQARYYANNRLDTLPVGEATDFRKWGNLAVRKHQEAMDMLNAGKLEEATKLQKDVLVYRMLEKRAYELNQKYEKKVTRMAARSRTIAREHSMDADDTYLYNHLLYLFGLTEKDAPKPADFPGVRQQLLMTADGIVDDNVPESSWIKPNDWLMNIITGEVPMKDGLNSLTMEQFRDVEELMQYVYNAGKDRNSIKTLTDEEGNQITIEELNASIAFEAGKKRDLRDTRKNVGGDSLLENAMRAARQYKVELIKPETILNALGESAMKYLYNPLRQCADKELRMNQELVKKQSAVFAQYRDYVIQAMGKKEGEKFLKDFSSKQQYVLGGMTRFRESKLTHEELICLALNLGTEIGHKRVLDIYEMNEGKLRDLLYNLSGADWNLIQNIWDLHEEYWPELQKVTANVTGVTMEKQEARTFTVMSKDGVSYPIKGGYYHLAYDPTKNLKINEQKADERLTTQSGSNRRFGIGIGMTKERNQYEVRYALKLDLGVMQRALAETVHYISFYETVKDVNRLINTYEFAETVTSYFGEEHYQTLQKWVKDVWALEPESKTAIELLNAAMRANQTMATLGFSMITAAENILNIAPMMAEIGPLNALKAVMGYYGQMMATGLTNPMAMFDQNAFIAEHSIFMAERGKSIDPNIHKAQKDNGLNADNIIKKGFKNTQDAAFYFIAQTDLMLGRPLWMHEYQRVYNECVAKNMSPDVAERKAVQAGDTAVRHVFGSAADVDKAAVQRSSNELMKFATMFYSYFSTVHNAMVAKGYEYQEQRHKGANMFKAAAPSLIWGAMMWYLLPAIGSAVMRAYFKGSDDDREPDALAKKIASTLVSNIFGGLPFLRDLVPTAVDMVLGERIYGFRNAPMYEAGKQALTTVNTIVKAVQGDKDAFDVMRSLARVSVYMSRFPLTATNAMITAAQWINESDLSDDEMAEYMRAMVMNQKPKK